MFARGYQGFNVANTVPKTGGTFTGNISAPNLSGTIFSPELLSTVTISDGDNGATFDNTLITDDFTHYKIITDDLTGNLNGSFTLPRIYMRFGTNNTASTSNHYSWSSSFVFNRRLTRTQAFYAADYDQRPEFRLIGESDGFGFSHGCNLEIDLVNLRNSLVSSGYVLGSSSHYYNSYYQAMAIVERFNGGYHHENLDLGLKTAKTNFIELFNPVALTSYKSGKIKLYGYNR